MANGILGKQMSQNGQYVTVYTAPVDILFATVSMNLVNMHATDDAEMRIAITDAATPNPVDHIDFGSIIPRKGGILERTCTVLGPGEKIMVWSDKDTVAMRAYGLEEVPVAE